MEKLAIRTATPADAADLLAIYTPYVLHTPITFEYAPPSVEEFAHRIETTLADYPYFAAQWEGRLVGYAYASAFRSRAAYDWIAETSIYVRQDCRECGVGRALYAHLEDALARQHVQTAVACITYPNHQSVSFHESQGYRMVANIPKCGYKFGLWHDTVWMIKELGDYPEQPGALIPFSQLSK